MGSPSELKKLDFLLGFNCLAEKEIKFDMFVSKGIFVIQTLFWTPVRPTNYDSLMFSLMLSENVKTSKICLQANS